MGYVITAGIGTFLGLGLMIWVLRERSLRHAAERKADKEESNRKLFKSQLIENRKVISEMEQYKERIEKENIGIRKRLDEAKERLIKCEDPKIIKEWLDDEFGEAIL